MFGVLNMERKVIYIDTQTPQLATNVHLPGHPKSDIHILNPAPAGESEVQYDVEYEYCLFGTRADTDSCTAS